MELIQILFFSVFKVNIEKKIYFLILEFFFNEHKYKTKFKKSCKNMANDYYNKFKRENEKRSKSKRKISKFKCCDVDDVELPCA